MNILFFLASIESAEMNNQKEFWLRLGFWAVCTLQHFYHPCKWFAVNNKNIITSSVSFYIKYIMKLENWEKLPFVYVKVQFRDQ